MFNIAHGFLGGLGLGGIFLGTVIEALGIPFPGGIMLVLAGVLANKGSLDFVGAGILAVAGYSLGSTAAYLIGRSTGNPLLGKMESFFKINRQQVERARSWMQRSAAAFILLGRFVPLASNLTPYLAGMSRLSPGLFFLYNSIFGVAWVTFNMALGYYFSMNWQAVMSFTQARLPYVAGAVLIFYMALSLFLKNKIKVKR